MTEWYYADAAQQRHGPMPADAVKQRFERGELGLTTLVWRDGLSEWRALGDFVDELGLGQAPSPLPAAPVAEDADVDTATPAAAASAEPGLEPGAGAATQPLPSAWTSPAPATDSAYTPYAAPAAALAPDTNFVAGGEVVQAGFWKRTAAYLIDGMLIGIVAQVVQVIVMIGFFGFSGLAGAGAAPDFATAGGIVMLLLIYLLPLAISALYFGAFHASASQATLGKMAIGIKVVRSDGSRITLGRGIGRYFGFMLSSITLGIGFLMAAFTERKQALHDMLCDTLVVDKWAFTNHPEWQQRQLGTVTIVILSLFGVLMVGVVLLLVVLIGVAASGNWH